MLIPMTIIFQSCLGSLSVYYILKVNGLNSFVVLLLSIPVICCMLYNAAVLAQFKIDYVFRLFLLSVVSNGLLILFYLLS